MQVSQGSKKWQGRRLRAAALAAGLAGSMVVGASAQSQGGTVPDAQVESNVIRQLASAPELSTQNIQTSTVYGTVTLTGNVHDEAMRTKAENLAARAQGVKKVVDELTLGDAPAAQPAGTDQYTQTGDSTTQATPQGQVLQSDGSYGPADNTQGSVPAPGQSTYPVQPGVSGAPEYGGSQAGAAPYGQPSNGQAPAAQEGYGNQAGYNNQQPSAGQQGYSGQPGYGDPSAYGQQGAAAQPGYNGQQYPGNQQQAYATPPPPPGYNRQPIYPNGYAQGPQGPQGGQVGGQQVTVAPGSVLRVRLDRGFDANHVKPGTPFSGVVMQDIIANGAVAIPRGAQVQGTVVDAKKAGVLKGEAELGLAINSLTLGGQQYALTTDVWQREGRDKTVNTVNSAIGLGAVGAILGGVAGGGAGAAIGAAAGGAAGVAGSAASPAGRVIVPAEAVLTFQLAQPTTVITVGQAELSRLNYAAGPAARPVPVRRYYSPYGPYYGPGYYR